MEHGIEHHTHDAFVQYYADQSLTEQSQRRFREIRRKVLRARGGDEDPDKVLDVLDVGCGPGALSLLFAADGHRVRGIDISEPLVEIARQRARAEGLAVDFRVGSADALPFEDASQDVCVAPELLEHVPDWQHCLAELARVLRPRGVLFLTTTNVLCPVQDEFRLPGYSWYPDFIKRRCIELARTRRPDWVSHAEYPAFHWFSFFHLQKALQAEGFYCLDRFDLIAAEEGSGRAALRWSVRRIPGLRFLGHVVTPYTQLVAVRYL